MSAKVFLQVAGRCFEGMFACLSEVAIATDKGSVPLKVICRWLRCVGGWWLELEVGISVCVLFGWLFWLCEYSLLDFRSSINFLLFLDLILLIDFLHIIRKLSHLLCFSLLIWKICTKHVA